MPNSAVVSEASSVDFAYSKVRDLGVVVGGDEYVSGFDVAMHDAARASGLERGKHLTCDQTQTQTV